MAGALQYWAFTWNANEAGKPIWATTRESLIRFLDERGWRWVFQHEKGEKDRDHWQGRIDLGSQDDRSTKATILNMFEAAGFDVKRLTISIESFNSVKKQGVTFYVTKIESRVAGPWADGSFVKPVKRKTYEAEGRE